MSPIESDNPYASPLAEIDPAGEGFEVPETFAGKLGLAIGVFFGNLPKIAAVVLTIWLPADLAMTAFVASPRVAGNAEWANFQLNNLVESLLGPVVAGALISLVSERSAGRSPSYFSLMGRGLRNWGGLFGARFFAGLRILVGLFALLIPGIVLIVRYALIDSVVVMEPHRRTSALVRSRELVKGKAWEILGVLILFYLGLFAIAVPLGVLAALVPALQQPWGQVAVDVVINIATSFLTILMFLYYVDGRNRESRSSMLEGPVEIKGPRMSECDL